MGETIEVELSDEHIQYLHESNADPAQLLAECISEQCEQDREYEGKNPDVPDQLEFPIQRLHNHVRNREETNNGTLVEFHRRVAGSRLVVVGTREDTDYSLSIRVNAQELIETELHETASQTGGVIGDVAAELRDLLARITETPPDTFEFTRDEHSGEFSTCISPETVDTHDDSDDTTPSHTESPESTTESEED